MFARPAEKPRPDRAALYPKSRISRVGEGTSCSCIESTESNTFVFFWVRNPCSSLVPAFDRVLAAAAEGDDVARVRGRFAVGFCGASWRPLEFPFRAVLAGLRKGRGIFGRVLVGGLSHSARLRLLASARRQ